MLMLSRNEELGLKQTYTGHRKANETMLGLLCHHIVDDRVVKEFENDKLT